MATRAPTCKRPRSWLAPLLLGAAGLPAQQLPAPAPRPPQQGEIVLIDRVEAKVGDDAILQSRVLAAAAGDIRVREGELGRRLTPGEQRFVFEAAREKLIDQYAMAQAAKTLGILPPDRIEAILQDRLAEAEAEQVRQFGTQTRWAQALSRQNRDWPSWQRDTRMLEEQRLTHELAVTGRLQNQTNLFITPRMLRDYYARHRGDYVYGPRSSFDVVRVDGRTDPERSMQVAKAAAAQWRQQEVNSRELADKVRKQAVESGHAVEISSAGVSDSEKPGLAPFLVAFAVANPQGAVSEPIQDGANLWIVKVVDRVEGRNSGFEDPAVQAHLRRRLEVELRNYLTKVAIKRARERTFVWEFQRDR